MMWVPTAALLAVAIALAVLWVQARARLEAERARTAWADQAETKLREAFEALAARALRENAGQVRQDAAAAVQPLREALDRVDAHVRELEKARAEAYGSLASQLTDIRRTHTELARVTATLSHSLQSSGVKGDWGELTLRRLVELSGMQRHVDFTEQEQREARRPDLLVRLSNGGSLPVDAKTTMKHYRAAVEATEEAARLAALDEHVRHLKERIRELGEREYWKQFRPSPEFVVMFVPVESSLAAAFERSGDLIEYAMDLKVLIATPVTLLALFKAVAHGWQQQQVADNLRLIQEACEELYRRLAPFADHLNDTGARLDAATKAFNAAVGSFEGRLLPAAERVRELGAGTEALAVPKRVETPVRRVVS